MHSLHYFFSTVLSVFTIVQISDAGALAPAPACVNNQLQKEVNAVPRAAHTFCNQFLPSATGPPLRPLSSACSCFLKTATAPPSTSTPSQTVTVTDTVTITANASTITVTSTTVSAPTATSCPTQLALGFGIDPFNPITKYTGQYMEVVDNDPSNAHTGSAYMKYVFSDNNVYFLLENANIGIAANTYYNINIWAKADSDNNCQFSWYTESSDFSSINESPAYTLTTNYTLYTYDTTPSVAQKYLLMDAACNGGGTMYFDDFALVVV